MPLWHKDFGAITGAPLRGTDPGGPDVPVPSAFVVGPARPSLDVEGTLDDHEWLELYRESLRASSFWGHFLTVGGVLVSAVTVTAVFGAPARWVIGGLCVVLGMLLTYAVGYVWLGPRLRLRRLTPLERAAPWRINADVLRTEQGGIPVELSWRDIDRVRVSRRLVTFELTGGRGLLALPRRAATQLGEALVLGWAADSDTPVSRSA